MIEGVKHLKPELNLFMLHDIPPFLYAHVPIEILGPMEIREKPRSISKGECGRLRERRWINPIVDRLVCRYRVDSGHHIRALVETETNIVRRWCDGKRQS